MKFTWVLILNLLAWSAMLAQPDRSSQAKVFCIVLLLLSCGAAWRVLARIEYSLKHGLSVIRGIASGKLAHALHGRRIDDGGEMDAALCGVRERLVEVVSNVRNGTTSLAITAGALAADNAALAKRNETQAALLEETAASTEQLASAVRLSAENLDAAHRMVLSASATALEGGDIVQQLATTMAAIRGGSRKIADIVEVINGFAFQTNILALNAAVEAARAGESGRGFAVVASEVRQLAHSVARASKEIEALVAGSVAQVEAGNGLADEAGGAMRRIVASVADVAGVMHEIRDAGREQHAGIEVINGALVQLDRMTQENARMVDDIADAAGHLYRQSVNLTNVTASFDLGALEFGDQDDAKALVARAVAYAQAAGVEALIAGVNDPVERQFADRDLYLVMFTLDGAIVAHGANRRLLDHDARLLRDPDGKAFGKEMIEVARKQGEGWVPHQFLHPVTQQMKSKCTYVKRMGKLLVSCGFYLPDDAPGRRA
ncbi:MAG: methyl-accepting chemotaxis protein [Pseudomonadota bacterium]